jgi:hypothetical protein
VLKQVPKKRTLAKIMLLVSFMSIILGHANIEASTQDSEVNNDTPSAPVKVIFQINPSDAGYIVCDDNEQKASNESATDSFVQYASNESATYSFGRKLNCQVIENENFNFSAWSGLVSSSNNPVTFRVLEDGTLTANLKLASPIIAEIVPFFLYIVIISFALIFISPLFRFFRERFQLNSYRKKIKKEINAIYEKSKDNKACLQYLEMQTQEIRESFKEGRIRPTRYEIMINVILQNIEKIKRCNIEGEEPLNSLATAIDDLIITYNDISRLLSGNITNVLVRTAQSTSRDIRLKRLLRDPIIRLNRTILYIMATRPLPFPFKRRALYDPGRGGYLAIVLFRRRVNIIFDSIYFTCHLYLKNEKDPQKIRAIQDIISKVTGSQEVLIGSKKEERSKKIDLVLRIVPIIFTILAPTILITIFTSIATSLLNIPIEYFFIPFYLIYFIGSFLILYYFGRVLLWYNTIIRISGVDEKEMQIYDYLLPIQRPAINNAFHVLDGSLDE